MRATGARRGARVRDLHELGDIGSTSFLLRTASGFLRAPLGRSLHVLVQTAPAIVASEQLTDDAGGRCPERSLQRHRRARRYANPTNTFSVQPLIGVFVGLVTSRMISLPVWVSFGTSPDFFGSIDTS